VSAELLRLRKARKLSQQAVADAVGVKRPTVSQWENDRFPPAAATLRRLDEFLDAKGKLIAVGEGREAGSAGPSTPEVGTKSLLHVLADVREAFLAQLCVDDAGRPTGWRHNLVPSAESPSVLSTAYGLKVLAMLGGSDTRTGAIADWVLARAVRSEGRLVGWQARVQRVAPRLETTATAIDALLRAGVSLRVDDVVRMLGSLVDEDARARPFILTSALDPLLRVAPDSPLTTDLVQALLACGVGFGGRLLWPQKLLSRDQPGLRPSVVHTARAVMTLRSAPRHLVGASIDDAEQWITETDDLNGVSETIERNLDAEKREDLPIDHFTATWVVRVLAGAAVPDRDRIAKALQPVWKQYDHGLHLWAWDNGDVPVWMLADAVAALQDAAFALSATPVQLNSG
jgi:transcriptional regulator with XRE-family HTH domain